MRIKLLASFFLLVVISVPLQADSDWPTYLHDHQQSGVATSTIPDSPALKWTYQSRHAPKPSWPPPAKRNIWAQRDIEPRVTYDRAFHVVVANDRLYFGSSADDQIRCLNAKTGQPVWSFFTEGPIRLAPTVVGEKVFCGSDDGFVYCLDSAKGTLLWKCRAGSSARRLPGNERVISIHPVRSNILVDGNTVHCCAGLFPLQGTCFSSIDIETGKLVKSGPLSVSPQGYLCIQDDQIAIRDGRNNKWRNLKALQRRGLTKNETKNIPGKYPYASIRSGDVLIGGGDGTVAGFSATDGSQLWQLKVDGKAYSLAVANKRLYVSTDTGRIYCFGAGEDIQSKVSTPLKQNPAGRDTLRQKTCADAAQWIAAKTGIRKGYCLVLGCRSGALAYELARRTQLKIVCLESDKEHVIAARKLIDEAGLYGRVTVHHGDPAKLDYTHDMFNLIIDERAILDNRPMADEKQCTPLLKPGRGVAVFSLKENGLVKRPAQKETGQWSHLYANAGNTNCSGDTTKYSKMQLQWFGKPGPRHMGDRHHKAVGPLVRDGRLFVSGMDHLFAVDAHNGTLLWEQDLPDSARLGANVNCGNMAVSKEGFFIASGGKCLVFEPQTGKEKHVFSVPDPEKSEWGYVAVNESVLVGTAANVGSSQREHSKPFVAKETYYDNRPVACSKTVFAYDVATGRRLWSHTPPQGAIINATMAMGDGRIYFVRSNNKKTLNSEGNGRVQLSELLAGTADVIAIEARTGKKLWSRPVDASHLEHAIFLCYTRGTVLLTGSNNMTVEDDSKKRLRYHLWTFDADKGTPLWNKTARPAHDRTNGGHGEQDQPPVIVGNVVYGSGYAFNLKTGAPHEGWRWTKSGKCGSLTTSMTSGFSRFSNPRMIDMASGNFQQLTSSTRPGCWVNIIPAGGMVLIPESSSGCTCNYSIQTSLGFKPAK